MYQNFAGSDLYPTIEHKAAILLYLVVKNHSFVDGNKLDVIATGKTASDRRSQRARHGERDVFRNLRDPHSTLANRGGA